MQWPWISRRRAEYRYEAVEFARQETAAICITQAFKIQLLEDNLAAARERAALNDPWPAEPIVLWPPVDRAA